MSIGLGGHQTPPEASVALPVLSVPIEAPGANVPPDATLTAAATEVGTAPTWASGRVQWGPGVAARAVLATIGHHLPYERAARVLAQLAGLAVSFGFLVPMKSWIFDTAVRTTVPPDARRAEAPFAHGAMRPAGHLAFFDSYHCSRYNTNTDRKSVV